MLNQIDKPAHLLVVILNYRTPDLTIDCLRSLLNEVQSLPGTQVVVSDNNSGDGSVEKIAAAVAIEGWQDWVSLMPLDRNGGFAFGNNAVIRTALKSTNPPPYFLLLNPDTIVHPGALKALVNFMSDRPDVGIAGSRLENPDGTSQHSAFRFPSIFSELDFGLRLGLVSRWLSRWAVIPPISEEVCQTDWLSGASLMVRREVFESVGLLDERYFMYFEELDFCRQTWRSGWSCWYVPQSRVIHLVGQSSGINSKAAAKRLPQYWFDSRRHYFLKNHGWFYAAIVDAVWIVAFVLRKLRQALQGKPEKTPPKLLRDFWANSVFLKGRQG
jgi:N-acetylglucosaminyl-diphospho-decaprenol L-rhamnosyltransferase